MRVLALFLFVSLLTLSLAHPPYSHLQKHEKRTPSSQTVTFEIPDLRELTTFMCAASSSSPDKPKDIDKRQASILTLPVSTLTSILTAVQKLEMQIIMLIVSPSAGARLAGSVDVEEENPGLRVLGGYLCDGDVERRGEWRLEEGGMGIGRRVEEGGWDGGEGW